MTIVKINTTTTTTTEGLECYSCGSLFNYNAPECAAFDAFNSKQRQRCEPGEACLFYTWKITDTENGEPE
jgi:hypothetical protein